MIETATNMELYQLVLKDAPYVIAAYGVIWIAMVAYVTFILNRMRGLQKEIKLLSETLNIDTKENI